jgi:hypothetical protein
MTQLQLLKGWRASVCDRGLVFGKGGCMEERPGFELGLHPIQIWWACPRLRCAYNRIKRRLR